jgi:hypothetical protein
MEYFVSENSIVRQIWGKGDTVLFIFAGSAAEFALNKAVDWLYFTGKLPADPLGRLFSTVTYAQQIIFSGLEAANRSIDQITAIHKNVEQARGAQIPDWAYRDVLFMLIDYSIRSFEVLERPLTNAEKQEVFNVFNRVGNRMGLAGLPATYTAWLNMRDYHLKNDLINSHFTADLYKQYRKHLGGIRYYLLKQVQMLLTPERVNQLLGFGKHRYLQPVIWIYKLSRNIRLDTLIKQMLLPARYKTQIKQLNAV